MKPRKENYEMRYMLLLYDNADTRDAFFGPGSEQLGAEGDAVLEELKVSLEVRPIMDVGGVEM